MNSGDTINGLVGVPGRSSGLLTQSENGVAEATISRHTSDDLVAGTVFDFNVVGLLRAFRRRWYFILPLAIVAAIGAGVLADQFLATSASAYTARTLLHVPADRPRVLFDMPERIDNLGHQRSQIAMVKSQLVLRSALAQLDSGQSPMFEGRSDAMGWLQKEVQADYTIAPEILRITMKGELPDELLTVLSAVRDAYLREILNKDHTDRQRQVDQLKKLAEKHEDTLRDKRRLLNDKAEALGTRDLQVLHQRHQNALAQLNTLETERTRLQLQIQGLVVDIESAEKTSDVVVSPDVIEAGVDEYLAKDPVAAVLVQQISAHESEIADYRLKAVNPGQSPVLKDKLATVESVRKELAVRRAKLAPTVADKMLEKARRDKSISLVQMRTRLDSAKQHESYLQDRISQSNHAANNFTKKLADLDLMRDDIAQLEDIVKKANNRIQALEVELEAPARASLLEEAIVIQAPNRPKQILQIVLPVLAALVLTIVVGAWLELQTGRISSVEEVSQRLNHVVVGTIPNIPDGVRLSLKPPMDDRDRRRHNLLVDSIDVTRAMLLGGDKGQDRQVLMVTSALPGEGKTSLAVHLALSLARTGLPTLLVDADFRCPGLHKLFGLPSKPGFADLLQAKAKLGDVVREKYDLSIITAGQCDARVALGLMQHHLPQLVEAFKQQFRFIVIDAPPVLDLPDTILLGMHADGTILSTLRDVSRLPLIRSALERLRLLNIPVLGAVLNGVRTNSAGY